MQPDSHCRVGENGEDKIKCFRLWWILGCLKYWPVVSAPMSHNQKHISSLCLTIKCISYLWPNIPPKLNCFIILSWFFDEVGGLHLCCKQVKATSLNDFLYSHNEVFVQPPSRADMFHISSFSLWFPFPDISDDWYFTLEVFMFDLIWLKSLSWLCKLHISTATLAERYQNVWNRSCYRSISWLAVQVLIIWLRPNKVLK